MPKMKTHSGAKKRFRLCAGGTKVKRARAGRRHHAWARSQKNTVNLRAGVVALPCDAVRVKRALVNK